MNREIILTMDPQGREIYLSTNLLNGLELVYPAEELYFKFQEALESPSCMIVMPDQDRYYFRSLAWQFTVLIHVIQKEGKWWAMEWIKNPEPTYIQELLKTGTFIAGSNLG